MSPIVLVAVAAVVVIVFVLYGVKRRSGSDYRSDVSKVSVKAGPPGLYTTGGKINGEHVVFLIDTGASVISIPQNTADRLGLTVIEGSQSEARTAGGPVPTYRCRLDSIAVGSISLRNVEVEAIVNSGLEDDTVLLGTNYLKYLTMELKGGHMLLRKGELRVPLSEQGLFLTNGTINEEPVIFLIDTGASVTSIPQNTADRLGLTVIEDPQSKGRTAGGIIPTYRCKLDSVAVGPLSLRDVQATVRSKSADGKELADDKVLLGMNFLEYFTMEMKGKTMFLH